VAGVLLALVTVGPLWGQTSPIHGDDILVTAGITGSATSARIIALPESLATRGPGTPPDWASKDGAFGVGGNMTLNGVNGLHVTSYVGTFGVTALASLVPSAQDPAQVIDIAVVPRNTPGALGQIGAVEVPGIEGGADTDVALVYGPTGAQIGFDFNLGIASHPKLLALAGGSRLVLAYHSTDEPSATDTDGSILFALFDRSGDDAPSVALEPTRANDFLSGNTLFADATPFYFFFRGGIQEGFIVVWESYGSPGDDGSLSSIQARIFDSDGVPVGGQFQVNTYTSGFQSMPAVATLADGSFVVVWQSDGSLGDDNSLTSIQARRFGNDAQPVGPEFQVNNEIMGFQYEAAVAAQDDGGFVVAWTDQQISDADIAARQFDATATPIADQFRVNTNTAGSQTSPSVATSGKVFMVAWEAGHIYMNGNFAVFADGFEGSDTTAWSTTSP
jgi:hypothetical protein